MKPSLLLPPATALIAGFLWLGYQRHALATLESEASVLHGYIDSARQTDASGAESGPADSFDGHKPKPSAKKPDWKKLLEMQKSRNGEVQDMRLMMETQKSLLNMSADELMAQLDEIDAMQIPDGDKAQLQGMLLGMLTEKDPKLAMDRFAKLIGNDRITWQINSAFQQWAGKDPAAAAQWMDQQIAAGQFESKTLDGKSQARIQFEGSLFISLLEKDPTQANARLLDLPADDRADIFNNMAYRLKPGTEKAVADSVRATVPADQRPVALTNIANQLSRQGLDRVDQYLTDINATPEEKQAIVEGSFASRVSPRDRSSIDPASLDEARAWAQKQEPDSVARITADALGNASYQGNFDNNAKLALKYVQETGSDEVLVDFLKSGGAQQHPAEALTLVDRITDPAQREDLRKILTAASNQH
jgi:hypothetical protein